jgi:transcriptional regulator with XRE-family HTH domain/tetratricopeptide (TPR) repeat protein
MTGPGAFGPLLRAHRRIARLTLEELAEASGVSVRGISDMERGRSSGPQRRTVVALADALRLPAADRAELLGAAKAGRPGAAGAPAAAGRCELPRSVTDFTGRGAELDELTALLGSPTGAGASTVALVSGPAGLGKTTLAVHAAHTLGRQFPDGTFYLDLRGMDPEPLPSATALTRLACALGTPEAAVPPDPQDRAGHYRTLLQRKRALVVLDDAADEAQVRPLLPAGGRSLTLVTSRRLLAGLEGVRRLHLGSLSPAEATGLLRAILGPAVAASDAEVEEVARLCGHLPLALRIAGNRLLSRPGWTARDLAGLLRREEHRLDQLVAGDLRVAAAFGLSYGQLSGPARQVFRRLALVPGADFAGPLAAVLAGTGPAGAEDALDELVELGLLETAPGGRYRFHDLVRLFARERLAAEEPPADRDAAADRMRDWLLDVAETAGRRFDPGHGAPPADGTGTAPPASLGAAIAWLQAEGDNWLAALRSAAAAGRSARVVEVADAMEWFADRWAYWGHWVEVYRLSSAAAATLGDRVAEARQLNELSWAECVQGDPGAGLATAGRALELAVAAGDRAQQAWAHYYTAQISKELGQPGVVGVAARAAAALFAAVDHRVGHLLALQYVTDSDLDLGRTAAAIDGLREILVLLDDRDGIPADFADSVRPFTTVRLGSAYARLGRLADAADCHRRAAPQLREQGFPAVEARTEEQLAGILGTMGEHEEAAAAYGRAAAAYDAIGARSDADRVRALAAAPPF